MKKDEFKELYLQRMHEYWGKNQSVSTDYAILMSDGKHTDFGMDLKTLEGVNINDIVPKYCRACREAVFGGVIFGKKYIQNDIACTVFMTEAWKSKSAGTTGVRPSKSEDKETCIIFQYIDSISKESTAYRCVDGELIVDEKTVTYNKNTN